MPGHPTRWAVYSSSKFGRIFGQIFRPRADWGGSLLRTCKTRKQVKKNIMFYMRICNKEQFCFTNERFVTTMSPETRDHRIFWDFRFWGMCVFSIGFGTFSVIFLHFLEKYCCVPKVGFRATFLLTFWLTFVLTRWLTCLLTFRLTFWLTRRRDEGRKEVDFFLKSNNPTLEGGEGNANQKKRLHRS